jgi:hypothetical protein
MQLEAWMRKIVTLLTKLMAPYFWGSHLFFVGIYGITNTFV